MKTVNVHEANSTFSQLIAEMELGEEVVIARNGVPVARLVAFHIAKPREPGVLCASPGWEGFVYDPAVFAPVDDIELAEAGWPT
jgi:antitoxin (DNA-binding transcriptional repressor) of toxin-antitoxin stability system